MPKIRDRATICWTSKRGQRITEDVITYDDDDDDDEREEEVPEVAKQDSSILTFDNKNTMESSIVDRLMLTLILDDMLDKLAILRCTAQGDHPSMNIMFPEYKPLEERYGQLIDYEKQDQGQSLESMKRYSDVNMVYSVIYKTLAELCETGSFAPLTEATRIIKELNKDDERLIAEEAKSRIQEEELRKQLRTQRKELESKYNEKLEKLRLLEVAHEDAIAYGKMEYNYLENWEAARRHQSSVLQERSESDFRFIITTNRTKIELENRIHGELVRFFDENAEELKNETSYWMYRYENEMESREGELLKLRMDRDAQMEKYMQLKAQYESQSEFIEYWSKIKEDRRIAKKKIEEEIAAVSRIQRWWRYTMRRLHLGPFRQKGKKGKKGNKKGKKK